MFRHKMLWKIQEQQNSLLLLLKLIPFRIQFLIPIKNGKNYSTQILLIQLISQDYSLH